MPRGITVKTPERLAQAQALRAEGKLLREIAAHLGVHKTTVHSWLSDPEGLAVRARKDSYRGACAECGNPTDGSNGRDNPSKRCRPCASAHAWALGEAYIIASIKEWAKLFSEPPSAVDWNQQLAIAQGAHWRVARYRATNRPWPSAPSVQDHFGTWSKGIAAAGYAPLKPGERRDPARHRQALLDHHAGRTG